MLMIGTADDLIRAERDRQPGVQGGDQHAGKDGRSHAYQERRSRAEERPGHLVGMASSTIMAAMKPTNAAVSIIPSMPMLTTPLRSFITPQSAPSAIGVASVRV